MSMGCKGTWDGSNVDEDYIDRIHLRRKLPPAGHVEVRLPGAESVPVSRDIEVVAFEHHFARRFGLPASTFFCRLLTQFGLQPLDLGANSILQLAAYVAMCEGFLRIES
ncbi:hypothetical protein D1007_42451 [Hordeum vulgare]|nr:hypothetical protein D1007_42451 [Hordeum vulgare]